MIATLIFNFPYAAVRALAIALALTAVIVAAVAVAVMVTPALLACCALVAPAVGQTLVMAAVVGVYAWWFKP